MVCLLRAARAVWMRRAPPLRQTRTCQRKAGGFHFHGIHTYALKHRLYTIHRAVDFCAPHSNTFSKHFQQRLEASQVALGHSSLVLMASNKRLIPIDHLADLKCSDFDWPQTCPPPFKLYLRRAKAS